MSKISRWTPRLPSRGVLLPSMKEPAVSRPAARLPVPGQVAVPLYLPGRGVCRPAAEIGQTVLKDKPVGLPEEGDGTEPDGCRLAPVSGRLVEIRQMNHPLTGEAPFAILDTGEFGADETPPGRPRDMSGLTSASILNMIKKAGIIDELDGRLLADKLLMLREAAAAARAEGRRVRLVADGTEQQPVGSAAWAVLDAGAEQVAEGLRLALWAADVDPETALWYVAVRPLFRRRRYAPADKTPLKARIPGHVRMIRSRYPIPPDESHDALLTLGVQACHALWAAVAHGESQSRLTVTVAGDAVGTPQNLSVPVGTAIRDALHFCGLTADPQYVVLGDALTGTAVVRDDLPLLPGNSCLLALRERSGPPAQTCIGCGRCVRGCHMNLLPFEIMRRLDNMQYERIPRLRPEECDGCGACSFVCPSGLDVTAKVVEARETQGTILLNWGETTDEF